MRFEAMATDELYNIVYWCIDRINYKRDCNDADTSKEIDARDNAISELIARNCDTDIIGLPVIRATFI